MKLEIVYASRRLGLRHRVVNQLGQFLSEYDTYDAAQHYVNVKPAWLIAIAISASARGAKRWHATI